MPPVETGHPQGYMGAYERPAATCLPLEVQFGRVYSQQDMTGVTARVLSRRTDYLKGQLHGQL